MAIECKTLWFAICDGCGEDYDFVGETEEELAGRLKSASWEKRGDEAFCPECVEKQRRLAEKGDA